MKNLLTILFLTFFASNTFALNLGDLLEDVGKKSNKSLDKKIDKIVSKFEGKVDGKIKKYEAKIKDAEEAMDKINHIRANAEKYIRTVKIILAVLSSGILVLLFVLWRIWRNIVNMRKIVQNVTNYDDVEKRLKALEKRVG